MPRQRAQADRTPYTKVLSALRRADLIRLCGEFKLSPDGLVVVLRNRLKDYLNIHRDTVYRNPRYNALYPRHPRLNQPAVSPAPTRTPSIQHPPSPGLSYLSDESWQGIVDDPLQDLQPLEPPVQHDHFGFHNPIPYYPPPSPSHSEHSSDHGSFPPAVPPGDGREYFSHWRHDMPYEFFTCTFVCYALSGFFISLSLVFA